MNDRSITKPRAEALAAFIATIRGDWQAPGIVKALGNAKQRPDKPDAYQVAIAAIRCAAEPTNRTPAVIALDGQHWRAAPRDDGPKPTPTATHIDEVRCTHCGRLKVEGDEEHRKHCGRIADPHDGAAKVRSEIKPTVTFKAEDEENDT